MELKINQKAWYLERHFTAVEVTYLGKLAEDEYIIRLPDDTLRQCSFYNKKLFATKKEFNDYLAERLEEKVLENKRAIERYEVDKAKWIDELKKYTKEIRKLKRGA